MSDLLFGKSVSQVSQALDWSVKRQKMITSNIANRDTPRYHAMGMDFRKMMEGIFNGPGMGMTRTDEAHFPTSPGGTTPIYQVDNGEVRLDGNTVDLSQEVSNLVENNMVYQTLIRGLSHKFNMIKAAIKGG